MEAGRLRHRIALERQVTSRDPVTGEVLLTEWRPYDRVWASIEPLSAREFIQSQAVQSQVTARIVIRFRDDVRTEDRATCGGRIYNIHGVLPDKVTGREYLTLPVSEGVGDGQ